MRPSSHPPPPPPRESLPCCVVSFHLGPLNAWLSLALFIVSQTLSASPVPGAFALFPEPAPALPEPNARAVLGDAPGTVPEPCLPASPGTARHSPAFTPSLSLEFRSFLREQRAPPLVASRPEGCHCALNGKCGLSLTLGRHEAETSPVSYANVVGEGLGGRLPGLRRSREVMLEKTD